MRDIRTLACGAVVHTFVDSQGKKEKHVREPPVRRSTDTASENNLLRNAKVQTRVSSAREFIIQGPLPAAQKLASHWSQDVNLEVTLQHDMSADSAIANLASNLIRQFCVVESDVLEAIGQTIAYNIEQKNLYESCTCTFQPWIRTEKKKI